MDINISEQHIHDGHRERMRAKLAAHGQKIFDTYELLEMLLYYAIPYKDTNPIAKRLLMRFGSLEGVLSASVEELTTVQGIGQKVAELIKRVDYLESILGAEFVEASDVNFSSYEKTAEYFVDMFQGSKENLVAAMVLDSDMNFIKSDILYRTPFSSGAVQPRPFINMVIENNASVIVTAYNNPYGATFATPSDKETIFMLDNALDSLHVLHLEHLVVSGMNYAGTLKPRAFGVRQKPAIMKFIEEKRLHDDINGV